MISLTDVDLDLGGKPILRGVSLEVAAGEKVALLGESGSGKSSLLKVLIGQHRPQRGSVALCGLPLVPEHLPAIRARLCYLPQEVRPIGEETAREFIDFFFGFGVTRAVAPGEPSVFALLARFRLKPELLSSKLTALSGGERQRIGLVRGLLLGRAVLLLDEVTSAVDTENRRLIVEHLLGLEQATIVAATHDPLFIERADLRVELRGGRIASVERS
jgi:putative ABC transport system ATP-binding protein